MTLAELGTVTIPSLFPVPKVQDAFDEAGKATGPGATTSGVVRFLDELEWFARALQRRGPPARPTEHGSRQLTASSFSPSAARAAPSTPSMPRRARA